MTCECPQNGLARFGYGVFSFNSFFWASLLTDSGEEYTYRAVRRWTKRKKANLFGMSKVMFPLNINNFHWVLVYADMRRHEIAYCDSMNPGTGGAVYINYIRRYAIEPSYWRETTHV